MKTAHEIQTDVLKLMQTSALAKLINGRIYRQGYRPKNSQKEDIVITHTAGIRKGNFQLGTVTINIYVPDIDPFSNGIFVEDGAKTAQLERAALEWATSLVAGKRSGYLFTIEEALHTTKEREIKQHFVVLKLEYRLFTTQF